MRVASGDITKYKTFVAVDATDLKTREPGLSGFTVVRSRNGAADATFSTPTVVELDAITMPGVYGLLMDEDMTIDAASLMEEITFHITHASMAPVTVAVEISRELTVAQLTNLGRIMGGGVFVTIAASSTLVAFNTDLAEGTDEHYRGRWLLMLSGALAGQKLPVIGYENTGGVLRVLNHTTDVPAENDTGILLPS